jgi:hypothetical protein
MQEAVKDKMQDRVKLTQRIVREANLPCDRKTAGYFSVNQLRGLLLYIVDLKKTGEPNRDGQELRSPEPEGI